MRPPGSGAGNPGEWDGRWYWWRAGIMWIIEISWLASSTKGVPLNERDSDPMLGYGWGRCPNVGAAAPTLTQHRVEVSWWLPRPVNQGDNSVITLTVQSPVRRRRRVTALSRLTNQTIYRQTSPWLNSHSTVLIVLSLTKQMWPNNTKRSGRFIWQYI